MSSGDGRASRRVKGRKQHKSRATTCGAVPPNPQLTSQPRSSSSFGLALDYDARLNRLICLTARSKETQRNSSPAIITVALTVLSSFAQGKTIWIDCSLLSWSNLMGHTNDKTRSRIIYLIACSLIYSRERNKQTKLPFNLKTLKNYASACLPNKRPTASKEHWVLKARDKKHISF